MTSKREWTGWTRLLDEKTKECRDDWENKGYLREKGIRFACHWEYSLMGRRLEMGNEQALCIL